MDTVICMSCYHPMKAFTVGTLSSGKRDLHICSLDVDHVERPVGRNRLKEVMFSQQMYVGDVYREFVQIPCGHCVGCRLDYSRQWANRCLLEMQYHQSTLFVTLTYDDLHIRLRTYSVDENGNPAFAATLMKRDLQLFFKRLRKNLGQEVRYFCAGEYGDNTSRPHYHCIIFGLQLDDMKPYKRSEFGFQYYTSEKLQSCWTDVLRDLNGNQISSERTPIGYAVVGDCNFDACAYTARYCLKKAFDRDAEFYSSFNIEPEFTVMSRRPGIGYQYYQDHRDMMYSYDHFSVSTPKGGIELRPPRYFDRLFELDEPETYALVRDERREKAIRAQELRLYNSVMSYPDMLKRDEQIKIDKIKSLKRSVF